MFILAVVATYTFSYEDFSEGISKNSTKVFLKIPRIFYEQFKQTLKDIGGSQLYSESGKESVVEGQPQFRQINDQLDFGSLADKSKTSGKLLTRSVLVPSSSVKEQEDAAELINDYDDVLQNRESGSKSTMGGIIYGIDDEYVKAEEDKEN